MRTQVLATLLVALAAVGARDAAADEPRMLRKEVVIHAPLHAVWNAWTTAEGLQPVSSKSNVELRPGGAYEWFLDGPVDENGKRGGEGARVLAFLPKEMLAFDWTFPPAVPTLRLAGAKTQVIVFFKEEADGVRVRFVQHGWQAGEDWDRGYAYFDKAWDWVLSKMKESLESR